MMRRIRIARNKGESIVLLDGWFEQETRSHHRCIRSVRSTSDQSISRCRLERHRWFDHIETCAFHGMIVSSVGLAYNRANKTHLIRCDLTDFEETNKVIRDVQPHVIVHCAAERKPDGFDKDPKKAMFLNVEVTRNLAEISGRKQFPMEWSLNFSSSSVSSGKDFLHSYFYRLRFRRQNATVQRRGHTESPTILRQK